MLRRTLLKYAVAVATALRFPSARAWAQTVSFPGAREGALHDLAATVLPTSLGRAGTDAVAAEFGRWVREYRPGAEMSPGYGAPRVRFKEPSPAPTYLEQLEELAAGALATSDAAERRRRLAASLEAAGVMDLSGVPQGTHVVADLMGFWFLSPSANDLAYEAAIGRNTCRTLDNSGEVPAPLSGGS
jgi:hypothetical protein